MEVPKWKVNSKIIDSVLTDVLVTEFFNEMDTMENTMPYGKLFVRGSGTLFLQRILGNGKFEDRGRAPLDLDINLHMNGRAGQFLSREERREDFDTLLKNTAYNLGIDAFTDTSDHPFEFKHTIKRTFTATEIRRFLSTPAIKARVSPHADIDMSGITEDREIEFKIHFMAGTDMLMAPVPIPRPDSNPCGCTTPANEGKICFYMDDPRNFLALKLARMSMGGRTEDILDVHNLLMANSSETGLGVTVPASDYVKQTYKLDHVFKPPNPETDTEADKAKYAEDIALIRLLTVVHMAAWKEDDKAMDTTRYNPEDPDNVTEVRRVIRKNYGRTLHEADIKELLTSVDGMFAQVFPERSASSPLPLNREEQLFFDMFNRITGPVERPESDQRTYDRTWAAAVREDMPAYAVSRILDDTLGRNEVYNQILRNNTEIMVKIRNAPFLIEKAPGASTPNQSVESLVGGMVLG